MPAVPGHLDCGAFSAARTCLTVNPELKGPFSLELRLVIGAIHEDHGASVHGAEMTEPCLPVIICEKLSLEKCGVRGVGIGP
jgi:hypothetical protein